MKPGYSSGRWSKVGGKFKSISDSCYCWIKNGGPVIDHIRRTTGEYNFAGQYQQSPAPFGGGLVKAGWSSATAQRYLPDRFERIVQSWDTANKATELSD